MIAPQNPPDEARRIACLREYNVLDTPDDRILDNLAVLAGRVAGTKTALISLVDSHRQWFKARVGLDATETPRDISFCGHVVLSREPLVVEDASADPRFADNPLVAGPLGLRFYAGVPLKAPEGEVLGTVCTIDYAKRSISEEQLDSLRRIAEQVIAVLELRKRAQQSHGPTQTPTPRPAPPPSAAPRRVMVVEDNGVNQMMARAMLQKLGCTVDVAADGAEALKLAAANAYELIFMDCQMPVMDGLEATRALRAKSGPRVPIVGLTGNSSAEDRRVCLDAGMDEVLTKPVLVAALKSMLARFPGQPT